MKTPNEKAKELCDMFYPHAFHPSPIFNTSDNGGHTKAIALKCVDQILKSNTLEGMYGLDRNYWQEVKQEIKKL